MEHLPKNILSNIASYADNTTRVLLSVALTAPSSSWEKYGRNKTPSRASKIVMSAPYYRRCWSTATRGSTSYEEKWERLSMGQLHDERKLVGKLGDGDLCGIFVCVNAKDNSRYYSFPTLLVLLAMGLLLCVKQLSCNR